ncbi:extracellular solute-binding protein [Actinophytocola sp.]|jgi:putative spermidine/putrescine transport system substrate-binding protein|uniref:extracellular solute-binding protein n=1 Tax=Actinophytocola sp. TaxID=1872138 RepID=UPI002D75D45E|nr:extracellular solute-binding protein [Actinophytocola sp.]HYQ63672.1 extracellular solute-binding protein [Actinophytocola sp.]
MTSRTRSALTGAALTAAAVLATACGTGDSGTTGGTSGGTTGNGPVQLTYVSYGGTGQEGQIKAFQEPYTAAHPNVTFVNTSPADVAQVKAQVMAGAVQWDVVSVAPAAAQQNCGTLFEKLDLPDLDRKDYVDKGVGDCYVGNFANATIFGYNAAKFPDPAKAPKSVKDFFDAKKFPGKRGVITNLQNGILEYPLLADGVRPDKLYPLDVDRALAKWATIRGDTLFAPNVGALQQAVGADQVDMFLLADSRIIALLNDKKNIKLVWDKTVVSVNGLAVPRGSKNKVAAEDFLESVMSPESSAKVSELLGTAPVNLKAKPELTDSGKLVEVYGPVNTGDTVIQDIDWYAKNFDAVTTKLNNWLVG